MPWTQADLDAIQRARRRGVREVDFGGRRTIYQSDAEMRQVESDIRTELGRSAGRPRQYRGVASKGLGR